MEDGVYDCTDSHSCAVNWIDANTQESCEGYTCPHCGWVCPRGGP
jgi:hypothetical protein